MSSTNSPRLAQALQLIADDIAVFPLQPGTKTPYRGSSGFKDATKDEATVRSWFEHEDPNIAFCPWEAGCVVLDIDHGADAAVAKEIQDACSYHVATPNGGFHCYFIADTGYTNSLFAHHVDVRGANGYVLAPGSVVGGKEYHVVYGHTPGPLPPAFSATLRIARVAREKPAQADLDGLDDPHNVERARASLRLGDELRPGWQIACSLLDFGLSPDKAIDVFAEWCDMIDWPWTNDDIEQKVANAWKYRDNRGAAPLATMPFEPELDEETKAIEKERRERFALIKPSSGPALAELEFWDAEKTFPKGQVTVLYGDYGSHKTNIALAYALRHRARTVYAAGEGSHGVLKVRIPAQAEKLGVDLTQLDERLAVVRSVPLLTDKSQVEEFARAIAPFEPEIVIIDTLATATAGSDENTAVWSALLTDNGPIGWLRRKFGTLEILAHKGKDGARGVRGHSGAGGNADALLECRRQDDDMVEIYVEKMRDGRDHFSTWWKITETVAGVPVPVPADAPKGKADELSATAYRVLREVKAFDCDHAISCADMATHELADEPRGSPEQMLAYTAALQTATAAWWNARRRLETWVKPEGLAIRPRKDLGHLRMPIWWMPDPGPLAD